VVFRWDLDKTYLKVEFDRVRDLVRIPFERAADKVAAPGVSELIRCLRTAAEERGRGVRIYFLTASPPQLGRAIKEKLALDGIRYDGIAFKNQLQNLMRGKFRNLREQVGYKLVELLRGRMEVPPTAVEFLFGDDWESDPLVYSLYADIVAGRVAWPDVERVLEAVHVDPSLVREAQRLASELPRCEAVRRIFISLERRTPPAHFRWFGNRLVPTFNYFQTAACLCAEGLLDLGHVEAVGRSLVSESGYTFARLSNSLADIVRRGHVSEEVSRTIAEHLEAAGLFAVPRRPRARGLARLWRRLWARIPRIRGKGATGVVAPAAIDYQALVAEWASAR